MYLKKNVLKNKPTVVSASFHLIVLLFCTQAALAQSDTVSGKEIKERSWKISDYVQIHGFVDAQVGYNIQEKADGNLDKDFVFTLRRARFEFCGSPIPKLDFRLQADMAYSPRLLDAWVRYKFCKYIALQVGQVKTPYTMDNYYSPLDLEFVELSQSVSALAGFNDVSGIADYGNGLEIGAMISGTLADFEKDGERIPILNYYAGVFGGNGINIRKDNLSKDFSARVDFFPFVKDLRLSGSVYIGNYSPKKGLNAPRHRYSGGIEYRGEHLTLRSEYLQGVTGVYDAQSLSGDSIYRINTRGLYAFVGYWFYGGWGKNSSVTQKIRPLFRYDYYVHDTNVPHYSSSHNYSFGLDWWPERHVRIHLDYTIKQRAGQRSLGHSMAAKVSVRF